MLNLAALRRIKPIGSIDDYEAGSNRTVATKAELAQELVKILATMKFKPQTIKQMADIVGVTKGCINRRIQTQVKHKRVEVIVKARATEYKLVA